MASGRSRPYDCPEWQPLRLEILARDNHQCQIRLPTCAHTADRVDHIIPWRQGGAWFDRANLRAACHPCNVAARYRLSEGTTSAPAADVSEPSPSRAW